MASSALPVINQPSRRSAPLLDQLARRTRARAETVLAPLGLRPRHLVAMTVLRDNGPIEQQALSGELQLDRSNLVGLLNELESAGLVERRRSEEDRRKHLVELTLAGAERTAQADFALQTVEDVVLSALSDDERAQLYELLARATAHHTVSCVEAAAEEASACGEAEHDDAVVCPPSSVAG